MQALLQTLQDHDLGHLRILAAAWGVDPPPGKAPTVAAALAQSMLDPERAREVVESLPADARKALEALLESEGRLPFADLTRRFGALRAMGPGRRDREKPWRDPASPVEALWYRGLVARAFADSPTGPQEFAFVPTDLRPLLPRRPSSRTGPPGKPADPPARTRGAQSYAIDDATTLLAALRRDPAASRSVETTLKALAPFLFQPASAPMLWVLLQDLGILAGEPAQPDPQATRTFLDSPRPATQRRLLDAWSGSTAWNDLAALPGFEAPGESWPNDPPAARQALFEFLRDIPSGDWWDLDSLIADVRERYPGFQRPGGDFDSWYLRRAGSDEILRGFEHWDAVEGALLRSLIAGPLHWLGAADLGAAQPGGRAAAFRLTDGYKALHDPSARGWEEVENEEATISPDARVRVPRLAPRTQRYQVARFTDWTGLSPEGYEYRITPGSLQRALENGLELAHIRAVLDTATGDRVAPSLVAALERWETSGVEGRLDRTLVLRVGSPEVLKLLQSNRATARYLGEVLGPTSVVVRERDEERLRGAAARLGLLLEPADHDPLTPRRGG